jgi:hypothetical protein
MTMAAADAARRSRSGSGPGPGGTAASARRPARSTSRAEGRTRRARRPRPDGPQTRAGRIPGWAARPGGPQARAGRTLRGRRCARVGRALSRDDRSAGAGRGRAQAAFLSAFRHLVQRSSLLVSFLWNVCPQTMQISRPLSLRPIPVIVASGRVRPQKSRTCQRVRHAARRTRAEARASPLGCALVCVRPAAHPRRLAGSLAWSRGAVTQRQNDAAAPLAGSRRRPGKVVWAAHVLAGRPVASGGATSRPVVTLM